MPIFFKCPCGKELKVRDELGGKRVKCPKCGKAVLAPAAETEEGPELSPAPVKQPSKQTIWAKTLVVMDLGFVGIGTCFLCMVGFNASGGSLNRPDNVFQKELSHGFKEYLCLFTL